MEHLTQKERNELMVLVDSLVLLPHSVRLHVAATYDDAAAHVAELEVRSTQVVRAALHARLVMYRTVADAIWQTVGGRPRL